MMRTRTWAQPCVKCGTTGGRVPTRQSRPGRKQGMCFRCYDAISNHDDINLNPYTSPYAHPFFPAPNDVEAFNFYLWHDVNGDPQPHGVMPWCADECGPEVDATLERVAARWLLDHPDQLLDWPDPTLALFGAANDKSRAA